MNLHDITLQGFILALFIRDDGERFLLGSGAYEFKEKQLHFEANTFNNDIVEVQGNDGVFLAGQVRRASDQQFAGYVGDNTVDRQDIETYRRNFLAFFRKNHYYTVVYVFHDGTAIQRRKGFITIAPEVKELYQFMPEYSVSLNFEDVNYYAYSEDDEGNETYTKSATVPVSTGARNGGLIWDATGVVWDQVGATWEKTTSAGPIIIQVDAIDNVYPLWKVIGPAVNPQLTIVTTGTTIKYTGNVTSGKTLLIDMTNKIATLNGTSVIDNVSGEWLYLAPGNNRVTYTTNNAGAPDSTIYWQEIVG